MAALVGAIPGALLAFGSGAAFFVRSTVKSVSSSDVKELTEKIGGLSLLIGDLRGEIGIAQANMQGEIGKLEIRIQLCESRSAARIRRREAA